MHTYELSGILEHPSRADKSAVGTINRPLLYGLPTSSGGDGQDIV